MEPEILPGYISVKTAMFAYYPLIAVERTIEESLDRRLHYLLSDGLVGDLAGEFYSILDGVSDPLDAMFEVITDILKGESDG